ncbi:hypothetical protein LEMLEM_LOCUS8851 [Lemmus lemmus]
MLALERRALDNLGKAGAWRNQTEEELQPWA